MDGCVKGRRHSNIHNEWNHTKEVERVGCLKPRIRSSWGICTLMPLRFAEFSFQCCQTTLAVSPGVLTLAFHLGQPSSLSSALKHRPWLIWLGALSMILTRLLYQVLSASAEVTNSIQPPDTPIKSTGSLLFPSGFTLSAMIITRGRGSVNMKRHPTSSLKSSLEVSPQRETMTLMHSESWSTCLGGKHFTLETLNEVYTRQL